MTLAMWRWPSLVRRQTANLMSYGLGGSNPPLHAIFIPIDKAVCKPYILYVLIKDCIAIASLMWKCMVCSLSGVLKSRRTTDLLYRPSRSLPRNVRRRSGYYARFQLRPSRTKGVRHRFPRSRSARHLPYARFTRRLPYPPLCLRSSRTSSLWRASPGPRCIWSPT